MDDDRIRLFIIAKTSWIRKHQAKFHQQDREPQREYIDGESHYFWGQRYLLKIIEKNQKPSITIYRKKYIIMTIRPNTSPQQREAIMRGRYRHELTKHITPLITQRSQKMKVNPQSRHIKRMKTKR
jgi:predicted metal-dependent hydrolase